jgi:hypothetical protein
MPKPDLEVEDILEDIRRKVLNENAIAANGAQALVDRDGETGASAIRIETYLKTTDQLRASLPPVRSYRSGAKAKIEIWIKSKIKRAAKWFFFDQVNFNSAVHQILCEMNAVQVRQESMIAEFRRAVQLEAQRREQQLRAFNEAQKAINEEHRLSNEEQQSLLIAEQRKANEEQNATLEHLRIEMSETAVVIDRMRRSFEHRLTRLEDDAS